MQKNPNATVKVSIHFLTHLNDKVDIVMFINRMDRHSAILLR